MVSNDIELRMIAAQITMKASVGAEDLCSRYSSVSRMLGNMFNDVYYILQDVRYRYKYKQRMSKETFDFSEALRRMKEGKKVRRIGWGIVDKLWIDKDKNINIFYKATTHSSEGFIHIFPSCWSYFTCEDILATDWEEV